MVSSILITGANRGLGLEFVRQYLADDWHVIATCRNTDAATSLQELQATYNGLQIMPLDVADFAAIDELASELGGRPIDVLVNNAGLFGPKRQADGDLRQSFGHIDYDIWTELLRVNTLAPLKLVEALIGNIAASEQKKVVTISSRIGSIGETDAGLYAYRSSKAAVNMAMATLANDVSDMGITVITFSPGWVKTDMGGPSASLEAEESIARLRGLIAEQSLEDSGAFLDYTGESIPW
ncbi:MAG: SDR family oxidoreductase [Gammaproteobacteria bacterium]|nr:SDR family oxidoreductase [Gammaproteobacteria bacterium]